MRWLQDLWAWLRSYPRPWRMVRIIGDVTADGDCIIVGPGVSLEIRGNIIQTGPGYTIRFDAGANGLIGENLVSSRT